MNAATSNGNKAYREHIPNEHHRTNTRYSTCLGALVLACDVDGGLYDHFEWVSLPSCCRRKKKNYDF